MQDGKRIDIPGPKIDGFPAESNITPEYCKNEFAVLGDRDRFSEVGGFDQLNTALGLPMVLVMSIWDDVSTHTLSLLLPPPFYFFFFSFLFSFF